MRLIVFSDDWGRHPSSCQHLVRRLLGRHSTIWVNTIGMRVPSIGVEDTRKVGASLRQWILPQPAGGDVANLHVLAPPMYPSFSKPWKRRLNARLVGSSVARALARAGDPPERRRVAITTLPIAAPLLGPWRVDACVYYCVDDWCAWPGLDGEFMRDLERQLLEQTDKIVVTSPALQERFSSMGQDSTLLTHGVDLDLWSATSNKTSGGGPMTADTGTEPWRQKLGRLSSPIVLFWGLIDGRLDVDWLRALGRHLSRTGGTLVLAGPTQAPDRAIRSLDRVVLLGPVRYESLPNLAAQADVLVMPYADLPVTHAMQPLKFKEYLASRKPVVCRNLPALRDWADAADLVETADEFVRLVSERARTGTPTSQTRARLRLQQESWQRKSDEFESILLRC